jgi:D-alanyl-D-alanine dipeptidase
MKKYSLKLIFTILISILSLSVFLNADLVEVIKLNPNIRLDIKYATKNNFTGKVVYPSSKCYLQEEAAKALCAVEKELEKKGLGLKVFDGYRPFNVQEIFWKIFPVDGYVAKPVRGADNKPQMGSRHNRGAAVDLTLVDLKTGKELEMPSEFDEFSTKANRNWLIATNEAATLLTQTHPKALENVKALESCMKKHHFAPLETEWWHFDFEGWEKYPLLDITFAQLEKQKS